MGVRRICRPFELTRRVPRSISQSSSCTTTFSFFPTDLGIRRRTAAILARRCGALKGFFNIVVDACLQSSDFFLLRVPCSDCDEGNLRLGGDIAPCSGSDCVGGKVRFKDDKIGTGSAQAFPGMFRVVGLLNFVPASDKDRSQALPRLGIFIDDENPSRFHSGYLLEKRNFDAAAIANSNRVRNFVDQDGAIVTGFGGTGGAGKGFEDFVYAVGGDECLHFHFRHIGTILASTIDTLLDVRSSVIEDLTDCYFLAIQIVQSGLDLCELERADHGLDFHHLSNTGLCSKHIPKGLKKS